MCNNERVLFMTDNRPVIAVIGATGAQGGAVVRALTDRGVFRVRAITRDPAKYSGPADEVAMADLSDPGSLESAFANAYGVFALSDFTGAGPDEFTQGRHSVEAASRAGIRYFVWSTLPDVEEIQRRTVPRPALHGQIPSRCARTRRWVRVL